MGIHQMWSQEIKIDSSAVQIDSLDQDYKKRGLKDIFEGKPGRAALYSVVLPGAGQAYNRKWWKVPIALGVEGYFISQIVRKRRAYRKLNFRWHQSLIYDVSTLNYEIPYTSSSQIKEDRDDARQEMEYSWVYWGLARIIVTFEAFVNRHLLDFDVSEDLSFKFNLESSNPNFGSVVGLGLTINLSQP